MAKLPEQRRILKEDLQDAPSWIDKLISPINSFFEDLYFALNKNITFRENIAAQIREIDFETSSDYDPGVPDTTALQAEIDALDTRIDNVETDLTDLSSEVATNTTDIGLNSGNITGLDSRVTNNEIEIASLASAKSYKATMSVSSTSTSSTDYPPDFSGTSSTGSFTRRFNEIRGINKSDFISLNTTTGDFTITRSGHYNFNGLSYGERIGNSGIHIFNVTDNSPVLFTSNFFISDSGNSFDMTRSFLRLSGTAYLTSGRVYRMRQVKSDSYSGSQAFGDANLGSGIKIVWCSLSLEWLEV